jgi:hypothetical protein
MELPLGYAGKCGERFAVSFEERVSQLITVFQDAPVASDSINSQNDLHRRLLLACSHAVQYASRIFRKMAKDPRLDILVAFCSMQGAESGFDPQFGDEVTWDESELNGYPWVHPPNRGPRPGKGL